MLKISLSNAIREVLVIGGVQNNLLGFKNRFEDERKKRRRRRIVRSKMKETKPESIERDHPDLGKLHQRMVSSILYYSS